MPTRYQVETPQYTNQPSVYDRSGAKATVTWIPVAKLGTFASNVEAKLAYLVAMHVLEPGKEYKPDYIRGHWRYFYNTQTARIGKVQENTR